jgi:photosystem II stability/assembly factor-like uncharacterized protein
MSGDERFEPELRSVLRDLASEPAPEHLVSRVASIPFNSPAVAPWRSLMRVATGLATAAVLVLVVGVVIIMRPGNGPAITGVPGASLSPSQPAIASPTSTPSAAPSVAASAAPTPAASSPAAGPVPAGLQVFSVTFASPDLGWALGTTPCTASPCTSIVRTADGGLTWVGIPAPVTPIVPAGIGAQSPAGSGVSGLRFADPRDGWAFGPDLWATHDGGSSWRQLTIPGAASATVVALEASGGAVQAVLFDQNVVRIASSPVGSDSWQLSSVSVPIGAGPVPAAQLVLSGTDGWLLEVDRTVVGGARLSGGTWAAWTPPCVNLAGPALLAASSPTELVVACDVGQWSTPQGEHVYASHDGGATFAQSGTRVPISGAGGIASPGASSTFLTGTTAQGSAIVRSSDGGQTWQTALETGKASITYLGFTSPTQGVVLTIAPSGPGASTGGSLLMTRDGGHTWRQVMFAGQ